MKKLITLAVSISVVVASIGTSAFAAESKKVRKETSITSSQYAAERSSGGSKFRLGVGISTWVVGTASVLPVSAWMDLNDMLSVQVVMALSSTSPFRFGGGGALRATMMGDQMTGFHVGLAANLGTTGTAASTFYLNLAPLAGFHYAIPHLEKIAVSFDFGPQFAVTGPGAFNLALGALSPVLGFNIHYFF